MRKVMSCILGLFAAAMLPAVVLAISTPIIRSGFSIGQLGLVPVFFVFTFSASVFLGLPLFLLMSRFQFMRWWSASICGALVGALVATLVRLPFTPMIQDYFVYVPLGTASAFLFWLVWFVREERATKPETSVT